MINKIDNKVFEACESGDFLKASELFHESCSNEKDCLCRGKNISDVSMCMISHLQYFTMTENAVLSEEILENYVSWRSAALSKKATPTQTKTSPAQTKQDATLTF